MPTTFATLGRVFLASGAVLAVATLASLLASGTPRLVLLNVFGVLAVVALAQGVTWTVLQRRLFGSRRALRRAAASGPPAEALIVEVGDGHGQVDGSPIAAVRLRIGPEVVTRRIVVPAVHAADVRPGRVLPVRLDPAGGRALVVAWNLLS